ncbi:MAG: protein translocase subunit SecF [Deltaproteobacteria bacterium]|nr:protein translocase subunit SecF [Deltaproteobacteria bacterium]
MAQWIKENINIDFVGRRRQYWTLSIILVAVSIIVLIGNVFIRGSALNYGTDFRGGSQVQVVFSKKVNTKMVRKALKVGGFRAGEVVAMSGGGQKNVFMLRLSDVTGFTEQDQAAAKKQLNEAFPGNVRKFQHMTGGDKFYIVFKKEFGLKTEADGLATAKKITEVLEKAGVPTQQVQLFGRLQDGTFEVALGGLSVELIKAFEASLGKGIVKDIPQAETVGAKMGKQLRDDGAKAVLYALLLMLVYIALRFDFRYAPGAVVALAHDVTITIGVFAITWTEFSLPVVAALLTIAGYSINDTIVVFDRIRENVARLRDRKFPLVVNSSINETLSRTVLTSITTLFTCVAILVVGTGVLKSFAFALTIGVIIGTYSSVFIASPLVVLFNERFDAAKRKGRSAR